MSIPVNQLRVGNYWNHKSGLYKISSPCEIADAAEYGIGIELTPEVLEKCGFVLVNKDKWEDEYYAHSKNKWFHLYKISGNNSSYQLKLSGFQRASPEHLHQLQNLFFALTGTELIYTP